MGLCTRLGDNADYVNCYGKTWPLRATLVHRGLGCIQMNVTWATAFTEFCFLTADAVWPPAPNFCSCDIPPWWNCDLKVTARINPSFLGAFVKVFCHSQKRNQDRVQSKTEKTGSPPEAHPGDLLPGARNHLLKAPRAGDQTPKHKLMGDMSDSNHSKNGTLPSLSFIYLYYSSAL